MVVSIDKATALRMHDKVQEALGGRDRAGAEELASCYDLPARRPRAGAARPRMAELKQRLDVLTTTDMARDRLAGAERDRADAASWGSTSSRTASA